MATWGWSDRAGGRTAGRTTRVAAWVALLGMAVGCSGSPAVDEESAPAPSPPSTETPTPTPPRPLASLPDDLRVELPSATVPLIDDAVEIDLMSAAAAPTLDEAPVARGLLLAQLNSSSTDPDRTALRAGQPYLLTPAGQWRQLDLQRYGFGPRAYGELSAAISSDGRRVALAAPSGLVTVNLPDNTFRGFDLPVGHAVGLEWTRDASALLLKARHSEKRPCGPKGCTLDLGTGELTRVPYDRFYSTPRDDGRVYEVKGSTRSGPGLVVTYPPGGTPTSVEVPYRIVPHSAGGPEVAKDLAFVHFPRSRKAKEERAVVVVEPTSGAVVATLGDRPSRWGRLGANTWLSDSHLLVDDWVTGDLWLWDVPRGRLSRAGTSQTTGVNVDVARDVMARRLLGSYRAPAG